MYANIVTIEMARGGNPEPLADVVRTLYRYWQPGMQPPAFEDLVAEEATAPAAASGDGGGGDAALSAAAQRVPAHLLERSRAGRERWKTAGLSRTCVDRLTNRAICLTLEDVLGALSRADVLVPRWGDVARSRCDEPADSIDVVQFVNASDGSERVVGRIAVIAGLLEGVLDALSFRRDQRRVLLVNPAVTPRGRAGGGP